METTVAPSPRHLAATVWTGTEFVFWGGMGPITTYSQAATSVAVVARRPMQTPSWLAFS